MMMRKPPQRQNQRALAAGKQQPPQQTHLLPRRNKQQNGGRLYVNRSSSSPSSPQSSSSARKLILVAIMLTLLSLWSGFVVRKYNIINGNNNSQSASAPVSSATDEHAEDVPPSSLTAPGSDKKTWIPSEFDDVLYRARERRDFCRKLDQNFHGFDRSYTVKAGTNETLATLPAFGIIDAIEKYKTSNNPDNDKWKCVKPHRRSCGEERFSVVFMAYNPDRLEKTFKQIKSMLSDKNWKTIVEEVVLVWNGERHIDESDSGKVMLEYEKEAPFRITYPLKMGFPNDLLNRYHPEVVNVTKTKAILYYDDDGPFYSFEAVQAGFELWKRHSTAQIGAMARQINLGKRQLQERKDLSEEPNDRLFVSHCDNLDDQVDYNFRYFANYDANMVLPSGSFLHVNYLCHVWHPILSEVRDFVRSHPVHPDDMTVSLIVSQVAGRAPRVYSRRIKPPDKFERKRGEEIRRRLQTGEEDDSFDEDEYLLQAMAVAADDDDNQQSHQQNHRKLLFSIDWDAHHNMNDMKRYWAALRTEAINSLVRYFGSINSGSIGWCADTEYYNPKKDGRCDPTMARLGWLPWMEDDGSVKEYCP